MNPIQMYRDWNMVKREKEGILSALQQTRPGAGITYDITAAELRLTKTIVARVVTELCNMEGIEGNYMGSSCTFMRKVDMHKSMSEQAYTEQQFKGGILNRESIHQLGLGDKAELPTHFLSGLTDADYDAINGTPEEQERAISGHGYSGLKNLLLDANGRPVKS